MTIYEQFRHNLAEKVKAVDAIIAFQAQQPGFGETTLACIVEHELKQIEIESKCDLDKIANYGRGIARMRRRREKGKQK